MIFNNDEELLEGCCAEIADGNLDFKDLDVFKEKAVDNLIDTILLSDSTNLTALYSFMPLDSI
jgi:hypothetical protein